jgi:hypothetical protein
VNQLFNYYSQAEVPALTLCTPHLDKLYSLGLAYTIKNTLRYNAISELTFVYPQSADAGATIDPAYVFIKGKMIVFVEGVGYYIIDSCPEDNSGSVPVKNVTCLSLEAELLSPRLTGFIGTYQFETLLQTVLDLKPAWTIGTIDASLLPLYRTFSSNNNTAYNFLVNDMEKAYGCIFVFDTIARTVSAKTNVLSGANTNILLSFDNLVKSTQFKEITSEICTALYCYGGAGLDIHYVNPTGNNVIYNFSYFKTSQWMSQALINVLTTWEAKVAANQANYTAKLTLLENYNIQLVAMKSDFTDLNNQLKSMLDIKEARTQQQLDTTEIDAQIAAQKILLATKQIDIENMQGLSDTVQIILRRIVHSLFFTSRVSYHNFEEDVANMQLTIGNIITSWTNIYNSTSTFPNFNPATLTALTPTITNLLEVIRIDINTLFNFIAAGFSSYPPVAADITTLTNYINDLISEVGSLYAAFMSIIPTTTITASLEDILTKLYAYLDIISYPSNMTDAQHLELTSYIYDNTYTNNNIITTDIMTPAEIQSQSQILYNQAVTVLAKTSQPRYEFTGDFANFVSLTDYAAFTSALDLGKVINIKKDDTQATIEAALLELSITYDDPSSFAMTFGNSLRLDNSSFIYSDILGTAGQLGSNTGASAFNAGSIAGWTVNIGSISLPNAQINSKGYISFGVNPPSEYGNNVGAWLGYSNAPKISLYSNEKNYLQWDGTKLLVRAVNFTLDSLGNITATSATLSGDITALTGHIGGWTIDATRIYSLAANVGISMDSSVPVIKVGDTAGTYILIDGASKRIRSSNFLTGYTGFNINSDTGDAEFSNVVIRGKLKSTVFEKDIVSAVGGSLLVLNSDVLSADMTASDGGASVVFTDESSNTLTEENGTSLNTEILGSITISGDTTFSQNDILRMKDGIDDEWLSVLYTGSAPTYSVRRDMASAYGADANPAWKKGQAVVSYGTVGGGGISMSSVSAPTFDIFTHDGFPWSSLSVHAHLTKDITIFGDDVTSANSTAFTIFHTAQTYNGEAMGAGDILFGSNTTGYANMLWDISTKRLNFRGGTTTQLYVDTDGTLIAGTATDSIVRLNSNGIGIGTSLPIYPLDVAGDTSTTTYNYAARFTRMKTGTTSGWSGVSLFNVNTTGDMANGFGAGILFSFQDTGMTNPQLAGGVYAVRQDDDTHTRIYLAPFNGGPYPDGRFFFDYGGNCWIDNNCSALSFTDRP